MAYYFLNKNAHVNGDHEVHREGCKYMPLERNSIYLGDYTNCRDAVREAKTTYPGANGCYFCSKKCHTR